MASNEGISYKRCEVETSRGHYYRHSYPVHQISTIPTWQIVQRYDTRCKSVPTSWLFVFKYKKSKSNSCSLTLDRYTGMRLPVDVYVWISCFDIYNRRLCFPKVFGKKRIYPEEKIQECIEELIPREEMLTVPHQIMSVEVSLFISFCHKNKEAVQSKEALGSDLNKMQFSKL